MHFIIHPLKGANQVEFGMSPEQVRQAMNAPFETGPWRNTSPEFPTDWFQDAGVFAYYGHNGRLDAMEFHEPARPCLGKVNLLSLGFSDLVAFLARLDPEVKTDRAGITSHALSIGIYAPRAIDDDEDDAQVEAVLVGPPDYFDFVNESSSEPDAVNGELTTPR